MEHYKCLRSVVVLLFSRDNLTYIYSGLHAATEVLLTLLISQFVCSYIALYQDDWYQGYFIPKGASAVSLTAHRADTNIAGTLIMLNLW